MLIAPLLTNMNHQVHPFQHSASCVLRLNTNVKGLSEITSNYVPPKVLHSAHLASCDSSVHGCFHRPPPSLWTATQTRSHIWARFWRPELPYQYYSGGDSIFSLDRHGKVSYRFIHPLIAFSRFKYFLRSSADLWVAGTVPHANTTGVTGTVHYVIGSSSGVHDGLSY